MANAVARIPSATAAEPSSIMSSPAWLLEQMTSVSNWDAGRVVIENGKIVRRVPTIPAHLLPSPEQRSLISQHIAELKAMAELSDPQELRPLIGELLLAYAPQRVDAATMAAKTKGYLEALYDVPLWAVREAFSRWRRGEAGADVREDEYAFAPSTVRLRRLALHVASIAAGKAVRLQRLLDAEPEALPNQSQRQDNAEKLEATAAEVAQASRRSPEKPGLVSAAEQEARDRETRAYWQRQLAKMEAGNDAA